MTSAPRRICLLRLSAIGDTCHVVPVLRTLQRAFPHGEFAWIIGRVEASLMRDLDGVELIEFDKRGGMRELRRLRSQLAAREFDVLLHMQASLRSSLVASTVRAPVRIGFDRARAINGQWLFTNQRIAARERQHVMDGLFGFAEALGVVERDLRWDIPLADEDRLFASSVVDDARPVLAISPCSSQRRLNFRNWSVENYIALARVAAERYGAQILITGGSTSLEHGYAARIEAALASAVQNLVGKTSLKQLLAVLQASDLLVAPDSGPVHMANAAGTAVLGLYATSNPDRSGPYSDQRWVVNAYPAALKAMGRREDRVRWGLRVRDPGAMDLVTLDAATAKLDEFFAVRRARGVT